MKSQSARLVRALSCFLAVMILAAAAAAQPAPSPSPTPAKARPADFSSLDVMMDSAVEKGLLPGGVLLVGHDVKVVYRKAFGFRSLEPTRERMTVDTIFDLASLTKCLATAPSIMKLLEEGKVRLNAPVSAYLEEFGQNGKEDITIRQLLTHFSGLRADLDLKAPWQGHETAYPMIMEEKPAYPPGSGFLYSDINFETLGFIVERVSKMSLNDYAVQNIYQPLGMKDTRFLPPPSWAPRIAPTEYDEHGHMLRGTVHDPTARRMDGIAGHAGLFSTADDLALFAQDLLTGFKVLDAVTVEKMTTPQQPANAASLRGLGWDIDSPFSSNRGELLPVGSFGHTGFTGTSMWIDPASNTYIILLSNAVHPRGHGNVVGLRAGVANAVVHALGLQPSDVQRFARITGYNESMMAEERLSARNGEVKPGIDALAAQDFAALHPNPEHPMRVGLVTNQTGYDTQGRRTADVLAAVPGLRLAAIFSPEHGIAGKIDTTEIGNSTDAATGAPIFSVYGDTDAKRRPTAKAMASVDVIVYDIQDIGVRFYTYESTLGYFLEAAARAGKEMVVLDRPNPVGGAFVQGPVADVGRESFVGYSQVPVRHGMTIGELAKMFIAERGINARLTVVPMRGWMRGDWYDSTGLLWINPSPNMRSLTAATLYPGIGMIEDTNISVGRGTDRPFEVVGAPWIAARELTHYLNGREIGGVRFIPVNFEPTASVYANQKCGGVNIQVTDRGALDAVELGLEIAAALQHLYPAQYQIGGLDQLMLHKGSQDAMAAGMDPRRVAEEWREASEHFERARAKYLIY